MYPQAAHVGIRDRVEKPQSYNDIIVRGTSNVLEAAQKTDIERLTVASSSSMCGKPEYLPHDEDHPTIPAIPYSVSKLAADQYVQMYNDVCDLPTVALCYFTVYGPRMRPNITIRNITSRCSTASSRPSTTTRREREMSLSSTTCLPRTVRSWKPTPPTEGS